MVDDQMIIFQILKKIGIKVYSVQCLIVQIVCFHFHWNISVIWLVALIACCCCCWYVGVLAERTGESFWAGCCNAPIALLAIRSKVRGAFRIRVTFLLLLLWLEKRDLFQREIYVMINVFHHVVVNVHQCKQNKN